MSKVVVLDPGHDKRNTWNKGPTGYLEEEGAYDIAIKVKEQLGRHGVSVFLTRDANGTYNDQTDGLRERAEVAIGHHADAFLSIHSNAASPNARGTQVYYHADNIKGKNLASLIYTKVVECANTKGTAGKVASDYVLHKTGLGVLRPAALLVPSALIEVEFHTNPQAEALLKTQAFRKTVAIGIAKGILSYLNMKWVDEVKEVISYRVLFDNIKKGSYATPDEALDEVKRLLKVMKPNSEITIVKILKTF